MRIMRFPCCAVHSAWDGVVQMNSEKVQILFAKTLVSDYESEEATHNTGE